MLIKNARIYGEELFDIEIEDGLIQKIGKNLKSSQESFDASNLTLLPSFVDLNINFKNDKFSLENLALLEKECLKSGVSSIILRDKMNFDEEELSLFLSHLKELKIQIFTSISALNEEGKLKNISSLINKNAFAIELLSSSEANVLRQTMQYGVMKNVPLLIRCFEAGFDDNGVMNDGLTSFELGLVGVSKISELSEVAKIKQVAKFYGAKVVYDCLSLKQSLDLLDVDDKVMISIHHLLKDDTACKDFNTAAKLEPVLQNKNECKALKASLKEGKIKFITSLHSAKSITHKDLAFNEASYGIHSICEYISLCNTFLIQENILNWRELCKLTSLNPAQFLKQNTGEIKEGKEANLVLLDENEEITVPSNSLYGKDKLKGAIKAHFIKGERVF